MPPSAAATTPTDRLSERQRDCLRLLSGGLTPKEAAIRLDLSVETVHAHLKAARRTLGVSSSREAARLLVLGEGGQTMGNHALGMGGSAGAAAIPHSGTAVAGTTATGTEEVRDAWTSDEFRQPIAARPHRAARGRLDGLSPTHRALAITVILVAGVIVLAGLVSVAFGLQQLLRSIYFGR